MSLPNIDKVGLVTNAKDFSGALTMDLTDDEIAQSFKIIVELQQKYAAHPNTHENLESLRDEALSRLADVGVLATLDPAPCLYGDPPILEFIGKVSTDAYHKHGLDYEKKMYEVRKATERGEVFLGEKGTADAGPAKRRNKSGKGEESPKIAYATNKDNIGKNWDGSDRTKE